MNIPMQEGMVPFYKHTGLVAWFHTWNKVVYSFLWVPFVKQRFLNRTVNTKEDFESAVNVSYHVPVGSLYTKSAREKGRLYILWTCM